MKLTIISQYHPAAALHQPRLWAVMLDDWQNMPERVDSDFTIINNAKNPTMIGTLLAALDTEKDGSGGLGQWSVAYRDYEGKLCVLPFYGKSSIEYADCPIAFHNFKYDARELKANGMPVPKNFHDTMIMAKIRVGQIWWVVLVSSIWREDILG